MLRRCCTLSTMLSISPKLSPFSAASSSCQPIRCSAKKVDQRRCQALGCGWWKGRYQNPAQTAADRSTDADAQYADRVRRRCARPAGEGQIFHDQETVVAIAANCINLRNANGFTPRQQLKLVCFSGKDRQKLALITFNKVVPSAET